MDADRLCEYIEVGNTYSCYPHLLVPLLGKFKGENGYEMHVLPIKNEPRSGIHIRLWVEPLVKNLKPEGKHNYPALCDYDGLQL